MAAPLKTKRFYEFGPFRLDPAVPLLLRNGDIVPITPKALETLLVLVQNVGDVVEKEKIMEAVWPSAFVEESNLAQHISSLRKALGDEADGARIETIPKRGYRLIGQVREISGAPFAGPEEEPGPNRRSGNELTASSASATVKPWISRHLQQVALAGTVVAVLAALALVLWLKSSATSGVEQWKQRQLTANTERDPVLRSAISPDGKYLAYSDQAGIHVLVVETGESRLLQSPEKLCFR
jgi:DNA-binding winged helix-turn-helix (wHTH) protein